MLRRTLHPLRISRRFFAAPVEDVLHHSRLPTMHFQRSLPRLGVPPLADSLTRYLASQSVLLSSDDFSAHEKLVKDFETGKGPELQSILEAFAKERPNTSYITEFWFDMYLRDRRSVPLTHTPFMSMQPDPVPTHNEPRLRATNILMSSLRFHNALRQGVLSPEVFYLDPSHIGSDKYRRAVSWVPNSIATYVSYLFKAYPLDMSQFANLFASTRLPCPEKDVLKIWDCSRHVLVMRKGNFFIFDLMDESGRAVEPTQILANVEHILEMDLKEPEFPVSCMTATDRDSWTDVRAHLLEIGNAETLEAIDSSLFVLSLDEEDFRDKLDKRFRSFLYGLTPNRWFDKCFSVIMGRGGDTAINFEHSWGDGVAVLRYFNELFDDSTKKPVVGPETKVPAGISPTVRQLHFKLDGKVEEAITKARQEFETRAQGLDIDRCILDTFGKSTVKRAKLSPDSVMQLIIQVAYFNMYGHSPSTYESCSTSAFKHGRTETVRSATPETLAFCHLLASSASSSELLAAMRKCSDKHNQLTKEAAMGKGWDRHLFALRKMADESAVPLFQDEAYRRINHIILSTSTLSSPAVDIGGFAAVTHNGYGVGYGIQDAGLGCVVTAYPELGGTSVSDFLSAFGDAARQVKAVMEKAEE